MIRTDKPAPFRIIVAGLQIIQPCFGIVIVPAVTEWVQVSDMRRIGADVCAAAVKDCGNLSPFIVLILRCDCTGAIDQIKHISLKVRYINASIK